MKRKFFGLFWLFVEIFARLSRLTCKDEVRDLYEDTNQSHGGFPRPPP